MVESETVQETDSLENIPNDILFYIFSNYLDFDSKLQSERVCHRWRDIIKIAFSAKRSLIISDFDINNKRYYESIMKSNKLSFVIVSKNNERNEEKERNLISLIVSKYTNLGQICVTLKNTKCKTKLLEAIANNCNKDLYSMRIELNECTANGRLFIITHEEVESVCQKFPNLKHFYIDFISLYLSDTCLQTLFQLWTKLETFILRSQCCRGISGVVNSEVEHTTGTSLFVGQSFLSISKSLVNLEVPGNVLNANAIAKVADLRLQRMIVYKFNVATIEIISSNAQFQTLQTFGLSIDNNLTELEMYFLMENIGKLRDLKELFLTIVNDIHINSNCIKFLKNCTELKRLQFYLTVINKECVETMARCLPQLQTLEIWTNGLNQNTCIRDDVVFGIRAMQNLQKLNLSGQRFVSDKSVAEIITDCKKLKFIDVRNTKAAILTFKTSVERVSRVNQKLVIMVHESPISRLFGIEIKKLVILENLVLSNEECDFKTCFTV